MYIGFGLVAASLSPLVGTINADLGMTRSQMGTVLGTWQFVYLFAAVPAGKFLDRFGLRYGLFVGSLLIASSGLLRSLAPGWGTLMLAVGLFGLGGPLVSIGAPTLVSKWFSGAERGMATGIAVSGPVVGSMVTLLSANAILMPAFGDQWRFVVATYACGALVAAVIWMVVTHRPPTDMQDPWARPQIGRVSSRALLQVPLVRTILVLAVFTFFVNHGIGSWLPEVLVDHGLSPTEAGAWAAFTSIPGLAAGVLVPRAATPERRRLLLISAYALLGIGLVPLALAWSPATAGGILIYGAMRSSVLPVAMLFLMDSDDVGPANMAGASALYFTAGEVGGVTGPVMIGIVADASGFGPAVTVMVVVAFALAVVASTIRNPLPSLGR